MNVKLALASAMFFLSAPIVQAQQGPTTGVWTIDPMHSQANFEVRHLGVTNVRGAFGHVAGVVNLDEHDASKSNVTADIDTTTVNTQTEMRDKDLKSDHFFNVDKYPTMHFRSTGVRRQGGKLKVVGDLTLTGVTKPVTLEVDGPAAPQKGMQGGLVSGFSAFTTIKRSDFNFGSGVPSAVVGDDVKITLDIEIDQK